MAPGFWRKRRQPCSLLLQPLGSSPGENRALPHCTPGQAPSPTGMQMWSCGPSMQWGGRAVFPPYCEVIPQSVGVEGWLTFCRVMAGRAIQATPQQQRAALHASQLNRPGRAFSCCSENSCPCHMNIVLMGSGPAVRFGVCNRRSCMQGMLLRKSHEGGRANV